MRFVRDMVLTLLLMLALAPAAEAQRAPGARNTVQLALQAETPRPAPGQRVDVALVMTPDKGWHGYWQNPGDAGLPMKAEWTLPAGASAAPLRYPVPQDRLILSGLMNYVYERPYALVTTLTVPAGARVGQAFAVRLKAEWLACTDTLCVPQRGEYALDLTVGDGAVAPAERARFDGWRAKLPRPLGAPARIAYQDGKARFAIPFPGGKAGAGAYLYPATRDAFSYAAPQAVTRQGDALIVEVPVKSGQARLSAFEGVLAFADGQGFGISATPGTVPPAGTPLDSAGSASGTALILALLGALVGGLLLNVMPCVFPILSLKALSLAKAGGDERGARREALAYTAGAVLTCLALGGVLLGLRAGGASVGWAFQLQHPVIILALLLLVTAIALNLAGLFAIGSLDIGGRWAGAGGKVGAFWTGALAAFVATPCTGPFLGAALGAALILPTAAALLLFAGLGLGLALPFLALAYIPWLRRRLPRPGDWMETLRRILSLPMFLTALALAWLLGRQGGVPGMTLGLAAALGLGLLLWWLGAAQRRGKPRAAIVAVAALAIAITAAAYLPRQAPAVVGSGRTVSFDEERLAALRAQGKPVFLYFTADWCLTCKANEAAAIDRAKVTQAFDRAGVTVMVGDWTNADAAIGRFLARHGRSGVPFYLYYPGGGGEPRELPQLLTVSMLTALVR